MNRELETAITLARAASIAILDIYEKGFVVEEKTTKDNHTEPVTIADRTASRIIVHGLSEAFPEDGILSEEEDDRIEERLTKKRVWMIDPIDGTQGFVEKAGDFAVQIGLIENGVVKLGVVFQPVTDLLYFATKGDGAFLIEQGGLAERLQVSDKTDFSEMQLAVSRSHRSPKMSHLVNHFGFKGEISHGSVGLKVGLLARQTADLYIHLSPRTKFWDTAAPEIIITEAGGKMTDLYGQKIDYTNADVQNYNGVLTSNGVSHTEAVRKLRPLLTEFGRIRLKKETKD